MVRRTVKDHRVVCCRVRKGTARRRREVERRRYAERRTDFVERVAQVHLAAHCQGGQVFLLDGGWWRSDVGDQQVMADVGSVLVKETDPMGLVVYSPDAQQVTDDRRIRESSFSRWSHERIDVRTDRRAYLICCREL